MINHIINECKKTKLPYCVAVPYTEVCEWDERKDINPIYYGAVNDVIARYYKCAKDMEFDPIIRVCADAKNIKHELILQQLENYKKYKDFCFGNFCEIFSFKELEHYYINDRRPEVREHVVYGMIHDRCVNLEIDLDN